MTDGAAETPRAVLVALVTAREGGHPYAWHELVAASALDPLIASRELSMAILTGALLHEQEPVRGGHSFIRLGKAA